MLNERKKPLQENVEEQLQSNQGFTLMEMLLCVLLSCIIISAIGNFMVAAIKQYSSADREINLQVEAQTVLNQLSKMIKEADNVQYKTEGNDAYVIMYYGLEETLKTSPASAAKIKIAWFHANSDADKPGVMYLFESNKDSTVYSQALSEIASGITTNAALMGNYVSGFEVTSSDGTSLGSGVASDKNSVNVKVNFKNVFKNDKKEYEATDTIKLRNKVVMIP